MLFCVISGWGRAGTLNDQDIPGCSATHADSPGLPGAKGGVFIAIVETGSGRSC